MKVQIVIFDIYDVSPDYDVFVAPFIDRDKMVPALIKRSQEYGWWDSSDADVESFEDWANAAGDCDHNAHWFSSTVLNLESVA